MADGRTRPQPDRESEAFWSGLAGHRLILQECQECGRRRFPRMPSCPYCGAEGGADVEATGAGTVYSWIRVERPLTPNMAAEVPYVVATVDLDGGGRLHARLHEGGDVTIGMAVEALYVDHREGWTELRFATAAPGGRR